MATKEMEQLEQTSPEIVTAFLAVAFGTRSCGLKSRYIRGTKNSSLGCSAFSTVHL
jgi:hypothetical protein